MLPRAPWEYFSNNHIPSIPLLPDTMWSLCVHLTCSLKQHRRLLIFIAPISQNVDLKPRKVKGLGWSHTSSIVRKLVSILYPLVLLGVWSFMMSGLPWNGAVFIRVCVCVCVCRGIEVEPCACPTLIRPLCPWPVRPVGFTTAAWLYAPVISPLPTASLLINHLPLHACW
jgi:hypothetical protein